MNKDIEKKLLDQHFTKTGYTYTSHDKYFKISPAHHSKPDTWNISFGGGIPILVKQRFLTYMISVIYQMNFWRHQ